MVQGELFREDNGSQSQAGPRKSFLSKYQITLQLDKVLLLTIVAIFSFALSHSFGVERGKRMMEKKYQSEIPAQVQTFSHADTASDPNELVASETILMPGKQPQAERLPGVLPGLKTEAEPSIEGPIDTSAGTLQTSQTNTPQPSVTIVPTANELKKLGKFTVQLVTYDSETMAQKEINRLKSKGYEGFVIPSGRFYQVCANYFENKTMARSHLEELKQTGRYPDAYIRPVVR